MIESGVAVSAANSRQSSFVAARISLIWVWEDSQISTPGGSSQRAAGGGFLGAYPTVRRFNIGVKFSL